jgi:hypothetical protein
MEQSESLWSKMSHSGAKWSHNEIGLINSPKNNTDDD